MHYFDGKKIRDQIIAKVEAKIKKMERKPGLAVICVGENPVCSRYVGMKKKMADKLRINFFNYSFSEKNSQKEIISKIKQLNEDKQVNGIIVQMPIPDKFDKFEIVHEIAPEKDVDGLRFCCSYKSNYIPPVVLAILKAIQESPICHSRPDRESRKDYLGSPGHGLRLPEDDSFIGKCLKNKEVVIVGRGFLVGWPLAQCLEEEVPGIVVTDINTKNLPEITKKADILISAVGKHSIIKPDMIKEGVVLIDAGTTEVSGELKGDIDKRCYQKASFVTPVPGGIGPVTIAMLFENLVK